MSHFDFLLGGKISVPKCQKSCCFHCGSQLLSENVFLFLLYFRVTRLFLDNPSKCWPDRWNSSCCREISDTNSTGKKILKMIMTLENSFLFKKRIKSYFKGFQIMFQIDISFYAEIYPRLCFYFELTTIIGFFKVFLAFSYARNTFDTWGGSRPFVVTIPAKILG